MSYRGDVCAGCVGDPDLKQLIRENEGEPGCDYCQEDDKPTMYIGDLGEFIRNRLTQFYGNAEEQIPYDSEIGDYIGTDHYTTWELLFEQIQLDLPRDSDNELAAALVEEIGDDVWSEYDWVGRPDDERLIANWKRFSYIVKHRRRFFFHEVDSNKQHDPDGSPPLEFLKEVARLIDDLDLVREKVPGYILYRARRRKKRNVRYTSPKDLGPPPQRRAVIANRMSPPGIPMLYASEEEHVAAAEIGGKHLSIGKFVTESPLKVLDLAILRNVPGLFSQSSRDTYMALSFLHQFAELIAQPIAGDERMHIDYIPTQVFTEFLRDYRFRQGKIRGIRYRSAKVRCGINVVLFATQRSVIGAVTTRDDKRKPWLRLESAHQVSNAAKLRKYDGPNSTTVDASGLPLFSR